MKLIGAKTGRPVNKNISKYVIDWHGPSRSKIQKKTKEFFYPYWCGCSCYEEFPVFQSRLKVDIVNISRMIAVEVHGEQHSKFNKHFHNNSREKYLQSIRRDYQKYEWLDLNGFKIIEIEQKEVPLLTKAWVEEKFDIVL